MQGKITSEAYCFVEASSVCCISVRRSPVRGSAYLSTRHGLTILHISSVPATVTFLTKFSTSTDSHSSSIASEGPPGAWDPGSSASCWRIQQCRSLEWLWALPWSAVEKRRFKTRIASWLMLWVSPSPAWVIVRGRCRLGYEIFWSPGRVQKLRLGTSVKRRKMHRGSLVRFGPSVPVQICACRRLCHPARILHSDHFYFYYVSCSIRVPSGNYWSKCSTVGQNRYHLSRSSDHPETSCSRWARMLLGRKFEKHSCFA